jgi:hypothetical protein
MATLRGPFSEILQGILFIACFFDHEKLILSIEYLNPIVTTSPQQKKGLRTPRQRPGARSRVHHLYPIPLKFRLPFLTASYSASLAFS